MWDHNFGPAVSYACGRPFADVAHPTTELVDFLNRRRPEIDCRAIPADAEFAPLNAYANGIPYFLRGLGLYWRWRGVSWPALAPLFIALYAVANVLVFYVFRQFLGAVWAAACSLIYALSPSGYFAATYYEHFTKVPIFLGILLIVVSLVRARGVSRRRLLALAALAGVLLGVGFGIRADLWLLVVPAVAALVWCGEPRPPARIRLAACSVLLAIATALALPAAMTNGRSYFWLQLVEGLSSDFNADLSIRPAIYEWIPAYNDELGASWMQAHAPASAPTADRQTQELAGRTAYLRIMRNFPGDFVTRPLAAAVKVVVDSLRTQPSFAAQFAPAAPSFFSRTVPVWFAAVPLGAPLVLLLVGALVGMAQRDVRQALFFALLVLYIGGSTAIAFLPRHRWHLYFIGVLVIGITVKSVIDAVRARSVTFSWSATAWVTGFIATGWLIIAGSRMYQDRAVVSLVEGVLAAPKEALRLEWREMPDGPPSAVAADLVDRFNRQAAELAVFESVDYVTATFQRDDCGAAPTARVRYRASQPAYDHTLTVPLDFGGDSRTFTYAFPAYATKSAVGYGLFESIEVPARSCLSGASRVIDRARLPLLITWHLPERWRDRPLHQTIVFPPAAQ